VDAEQIFARFFLPLYPADARADLARARATNANPAGNPALVAHLDEAAAAFVRNAAALFDAELVLDGSDASVHRLSTALTRERRDAWASLGRPGTAESTLFNAVVHGSAYVGGCIVANHRATSGRDDARASWSLRRPLWESVVRLRSRAGEGDLAVFHWWLKSLADGAQGTTLADRYRAHVEVPCARPEELPLLAAPGRALPRLKSPRYDLFHKYLRAHVPELRDVGEHFPSPGRFEAFSLGWLDFHLVGGGRMLLLTGASPHGLHLFWLSATGFEKSAFFPCDPVPGPVVRINRERVVAMTSEGGAPRTHEMFWWGP
jgi:hypothetical protein